MYRYSHVDQLFCLLLSCLQYHLLQYTCSIIIIHVHVYLYMYMYVHIFTMYMYVIHAQGGKQKGAVRGSVASFFSKHTSTGSINYSHFSYRQACLILGQIKCTHVQRGVFSLKKEKAVLGVYLCLACLSCTCTLILHAELVFTCLSG